MKKRSLYILGSILIILGVIFIYSNKGMNFNRINLSQDIYDSLTYRQKEFISDLLKQEEVVNKIPIGADYLEKDFISITGNSTLINEAYSINLSFKWDQVSNVSRDKIIILINEDEWLPIESPSINLYTNKGKEYVIDRTLNATFGAYCFQLSGKDIINGTSIIQAIPQKNNSSNKIIVGYIQQKYIDMSVINIRYKNNSIKPNLKINWQVVEF